MTCKSFRQRHINGGDTKFFFLNFSKLHDYYFLTYRGFLMYKTQYIFYKECDLHRCITNVSGSKIKNDTRFSIKFYKLQRVILI